MQEKAPCRQGAFFGVGLFCRDAASGFIFCFGRIP